MPIHFSSQINTPKDEYGNLICDTINSVEDYETICTLKKSCYEVIPYDVPVCLYGDIDCKHPYGGEYDFNMQHTEIFIDYAERVIRQNLPVEPRFAVAISSSPDFIDWDKKTRLMCHSVHIHVTNVKMLKSQQKIFWQKINTFMDTHIDFKDWNEYIEFTSKKFFDEKIYNDARMLRSVHSSKPGENRPLIMVKGSFRDTVVSLGDEDAIVLTEEIPAKQIPTSKVGGASTNINDEKIWELGQIIKMEFVNNYEDWLKIVWALQSESEGYKEVARNISKRSKQKYDDEGFDTAWDNYKPGKVTIGTFYYYCKVSDEKKYNQIIAKYQPHNASTETSTDTYNISINDLNDVYKCCQIIAPTLKKTLILCKERWWVLTEKQLWSQIKEPAFYIITEIRKYIDHSQNKNSKEIMVTNGAEKDRLIAIGKEYLKFYEKINQSGYTTACKQYLKAHLVNNNFEEILDKNCGFLSFKNGVIDLKTGVFREGIQWDDFITETIPYEWKPSDPEKVNTLKEILKKILNNNEEHLDYYLSIIGYSLIGKPDLEKSIYFMIDGTENGKGDNGKTFFFDILTALMPCYVYKSKGTLLEDGNAKVHKQLCMTKGKRLVWLDEFSKTKTTNAVLLKEIADGKTIENEVLFGTSETINILFKMFILSNHIPKVDPNEEAVFNRYKQVSFGSHFDRSGMRKQENPEKLLFIADCGLATKIKSDFYNEVFSLVTEYAKMYLETGLKIPEKFIEDAIATKTKNDEFAVWFNENCKEGGRLSIDIVVEKSGFTREFVIDGMKRMGYCFNKVMGGMGKNKLTGKYYKGAFEGCSFIEENENSE
jgi:phage/plasmid-associated DNA primase